MIRRAIERTTDAFDTITGPDATGVDTESIEEFDRTERLDERLDDRTYEYDLQATDPEEIEVALDAPADANFDLFVTLDGRTPTVEDHDRISWMPGDDESISLSGSDLDSDATLGLLVYSSRGSGEFTLSVQEQL